MDYTVHGILQARILEWVAYHFSRGSSQPRDRTQVSCIVGSLPAEPQGKPKNTGVGSLSLLHQIFLTQELNQDLLDCRWILYQLSYEGSPVKIQTPSIGVLKCERHCPIALQKLSWLVFITIYSEVDFPGGSDCKESTCNAGDLGWEVPLEEGMATHSSILAWRTPMDRGARQATVHGVAKNWTQLSNQAHTPAMLPSIFRWRTCV